MSNQKVSESDRKELFKFIAKSILTTSKIANKKILDTMNKKDPKFKVNINELPSTNIFLFNSKISEKINNSNTLVKSVSLIIA